jgi:hypothetical protein
MLDDRLGPAVRLWGWVIIRDLEYARARRSFAFRFKHSRCMRLPVPHPTSKTRLPRVMPSVAICREELQL